jgi:PAS domain S-box-containing protein
MKGKGKTSPKKSAKSAGVRNECKRTAALRDADSRTRSIVESLPIGMHLYRLEADGRLVFTGANAAADNILGVDNTVFIGKTIEEAFPALKGTEVPQRYREVAATGKAWQTENIEYEDNGITGAFEVHAFQTAPNTMVAVFEDVTARKRSELALQQSEAKYRRLYDETPVLLHSIDRNGIVVEVNNYWLKTLGYERDEVIGRKVTDFFTDASRKYAQEVVQPAFFRDGTVKDISYQFVKKNGEVVDVLVSAMGERDADGNVVRSLAVIQDITERKRVEESLRESEEKFSKIYRKAPLLITLSDIETGRFLDVNDRFLEISGFTREEVVGRTAIEIGWISEEQRARMQQILRERGRVSGMELSLRRKDNREVICLYNGELITVGGTQRLLSIAQDLTERKAAEVALQKSETMLQTIFDAEPECVKVLDENACLIMMNRAGLDMLQMDSLDQVKGQCVCPMVTSEYRTAFMDLTRSVFQGESGTLLFEMVGMKGRRLWLETHAVPLRNEKDEIVALLGVTRDVTERKRAEDELREKERKYRLLFESANDGIFINDETGFIDCNRKGAEMYGLPKAEIIGRSPGDFAPERQPDGRLSTEVVGEKVSAALNGVPQVFEWQPMRADGSTFDVEITLSRLELGGKVCLQAIVRDISERKRLEQERLKSEKLQSIGTLAGGIAHDFNNLLQGVFGYISMAKLTHDQKEKSLSMLEQAEKALHQSVSLTSQLLTFSKGGKPLKKAVDLKPLIENAVKFALSGSRVDSVLSFDDDLRPVEADEGQLGQVVQNIVLNAEQAMPLGGRIEIAARNILASSFTGVPAASSADLVEITVRDQGIGIPPEHLPKIFDPYFTTKEKGSGLGLATTYSIIKNHDGDINVSSVLGKGTTFTVYFPAAGGEAEGAESPADPRIERKGRVLVMDDEELVRKVAYELLTGLGHGVELAAHGGEAVEKYRRAKAAGQPFDVVILDLTIRGGMGGEETMRKLLEIDPGVKAIVSSGYSNDSIVANYRDHGFAAFLKKPYDLTDLQATLNALLG